MMMRSASRGWALLLVVAAASLAHADFRAPSAATNGKAACRELHDFRFPTHMGADGIPDASITRTFDATGHVTSETCVRDSGKACDARTYRYDEHGRLERETIHLESGPVETQTHRYDRLGREIEIDIDDDGDGKPDWITYKTYDGAGRLATMRENVKAGSHRHGLGHWYHYDANDRLILEKIDNDGDGTPNLEIVYRYDDRGLLVEKTSRWYDATVGDHFTYEYDGARRLIAETDRLGFTWVSRYDASGHLIEKTQEVPKSLTDRTPMMRITYDYNCR